MRPAHVPSSSRRPTAASHRWLAWLGIACLAWALGGCASLPGEVQRRPSQALAPDLSSPLVALARRASPPLGLSGFRLLPLGVHSLDARLQLIDRAQRSLDLQYYVLDNDATGRLLLAHLADAAARGVRVRLLVDDLYTTHSDALLRAMAALPGRREP